MVTKKRRSVMRISVLGLIGIALICTLYMSVLKGNEDVLSIGDDAPNFKLKDMNGVEFQLSDYKGKGVFLNFWATYCEPCKQEMPYMNNVLEEYRAQGVEILAINVGEATLRVNDFVEKYGLSFPILYDRGSVVTDVYNFIPLPTTFLIDEHGKIVDIISGTLSEASIRASMDKIKPTS